MNAKIAEAIRSHPEVLAAAEQLEHAILRAAEGAVLVLLKGSLPFPFSLAAPLAAPIVAHVEGLGEHAIDAALEHFFAQAPASPAPGSDIPAPAPAPAPVAPVVPAMEKAMPAGVTAEALQVAGTQGWRNVQAAQRAQDIAADVASIP